MPIDPKMLSAIKIGNLAEVQRLIEGAKEVDPKSTDEYDQTLLHLAVKKCINFYFLSKLKREQKSEDAKQLNQRLEIVKYLLTMGIDSMTRNRDGQTVFGMVKDLFSSGQINIDAKGLHGKLMEILSNKAINQTPSQQASVLLIKIPDVGLKQEIDKLASQEEDQVSHEFYLPLFETRQAISDLNHHTKEFTGLSGLIARQLETDLNIELGAVTQDKLKNLSEKTALSWIEKTTNLIETAKKSELAEHRGCKEILINLLICFNLIGLAVLACIYAHQKRTAKKPEDVRLFVHPETESIKKINAIENKLTELKGLTNKERKYN